MLSFRTSLKHALIFTLLCLLSVACGLLITGCSLPWQHTHTVQASNLGAKPTAQQLLSALQKNFRSVRAFHVVLKTQNLGTTSGNRVQIRSAEGDVVMPDKVKAQAAVILSGQNVTINLVSVGNTQFITDPITGQWRIVKGVLDPRTLTNPNTGIISLASKLQHLSQPVSDVVNGVPCWRITGQLDAKYIAFFTGGGVPAGTMLQTSVCVGKADSLPYQLSVTGQATPSDTAQTTRLFDISNYNENISITAPQM
jgi:LppX_LprAFG lipoprotein